MSVTDDRADPRLRHGVDDKPVPMAEVYLVLPEAERARGYVRPYRDAYTHVGSRPKHPTRDLTAEERATNGDRYVAYEPYPDGETVVGRFWTAEQLASGCGAKTIMGRALSETYARQPTFYGATYCAGCLMHRPVEEFAWDADGQVVGS